VKKKKKTFVLAGWKAQDLPKHNIWPICSGESFGKLQAGITKSYTVLFWSNSHSKVF
jgi:hypothetical protein